MCCNNKTCNLCKNIYCGDCAPGGFYCEICDHNVCSSSKCINSRLCNICSKEVCIECGELCECEQNLSITTFRHLINRDCNERCVYKYTACVDCDNVYCAGHDFTNVCGECNKCYCADCRDYNRYNCCGKYVCESCTIMCEYCGRSECEPCDIILTKCDLCNIYMCDNCTNDCSDCKNTTCISCSIICICTKIHCTNCIEYDNTIGVCDRCFDFYCKDCGIYCSICTKTLCVWCHRGANIFDYCKSCKSDLIVYKKNTLHNYFPPEIIHMLGNFIKS